RASEHPNVRMDWAEMLLRWFDQELKGAKTDTGPAVQVEDTHGHWTTEPENAYPPLDATPLVLHPEADGRLVAKAQDGSDMLYADGGMEPQTVTPGQPIVAKMEFYPLDAHVLPGSRLRLALTQEQGGSDVLPSAQTAPVTVTYGDKATTLTLPTVVRDGTATR